MTWWSPIRVLAFAREAGFPNDDAKRAATVALVATSGADHYSWETPGVPGVSQSGLWGIPEANVMEVGGGDQFDPAESARTAYALWRTAGQKWGWHPVVAADAGATVRRTLDALDLDKVWMLKPAQAFGAIEQLRRATYQSKRIDAILARYPTT